MNSPPLPSSPLLASPYYRACKLGSKGRNERRLFAANFSISRFPPAFPSHSTLKFKKNLSSARRLVAKENSFLRAVSTHESLPPPFSSSSSPNLIFQFHRPLGSVIRRFTRLLPSPRRREGGALFPPTQPISPRIDFPRNDVRHCPVHVRLLRARCNRYIENGRSTEKRGFLRRRKREF